MSLEVALGDYCGTSALRWAEKFCELLSGKTVDPDADDSDKGAINAGTMIGWFANVIEKGYAEGHEEGQRDYVDGLMRELERVPLMRE